MELSGEIKGWYQRVNIRHKHDSGSSDEHRWICKEILHQNQMVKETQTMFLICSAYTKLVRRKLIIRIVVV